MVVAAGADFMKLGVSNCIQLGMLEQAARLIRRLRSRQLVS
jgi:hypothetical protein